MSGAHPLSSDREERVAELRAPVTETDPGPFGPAEEIGGPPPTAEASPRPSPVRQPGPSPVLRPRPARVLQPRLVGAVALVAAGIVWAVLRGLHFYGLTPLDLAYDLDQPPLLLLLVGGWLGYRSRG